MNNHLLFLCSLISFGYCDFLNASERERIAPILGVPAEVIKFECPQKSYEITPQNTLKMCLRKEDGEKRCEITVHDIQSLPQDYSFSFQFKLQEDFQSWRYFHTLMQIHAYPDKGEKWRCPPFTMDVKQGKLSLFNRWDATPLSVTTGYNCAEDGSTIQSRPVFRQKPLKGEKWYDFSLNSRLSYGDDGQITYKFNGEAQTINGPNIFNDRRPPYLKLGIYKPTSWSPGQTDICVEYKDIRIGNSSENKKK